MTIISQDQLAVSRSFPGGYAGTSPIDSEFAGVALVTLLGLSLSALMLVSSLGPDLDAVVALLG
jgi:hypothetical protein